MGAHAGGEQRLVRVAHGGVGEQHLRLLQHPVGKALGAQFEQLLPMAVGCRRVEITLGLDGFFGRRRDLVATLHFGIAVDDHLTHEAQQLGGAVATRGELEQLGGLVDESGGGLARLKRRVIDHVFEKRQVARQPADAELAQRPVHAANCLAGLRGPASHLDQQRVVIGRDDRSGIRGAAVQPHPKP